ncbi:MAG: glutamyl-tRNA reductase [Opitutales bacterium]|jgi:glutamyl-tRNA reductase|nr:glutamyl-tRNA reductase [Opitutales bacterium]MDP4644785.1 glutamyl-tRNA reductase [Opitutales bacterium]MDP4778005.1 glutamyl-tRNA reductase [Opitutales bacterium]MDP4883847.1 glutamyl-tRNA reductase [Opitutales bacterium]MDP5078847.1 glutamyl-tRNA reductase [Opitutales bacterium]
MSEVLQSLFVLGSSHHQAPLEVRERFSLTAEQTQSLQKKIYADEDIRECLVVNTCNRLEIYGLATTPDIEPRIRDLLCQEHGLSRELFDAHSFWHTNLEALQHALEVCTGLDSQMVGETDILGQMKGAYASARDAGCTSTVLNRLFEKSFQAAKSARSQTAITRGQISIGNVAVDLASRIFGKLNSSRVLLLGSGDVSEKTAQALKSRGVADITVSSRTFENAHKLAHQLGGAAIEFSDFEAQLEHFDIIICSTAAPTTILSQGNLTPALKQRPERPCFLIDLAMPRDIAPDVEKLENVYLYNLDDLSAIANENLEQRRAEIDHAREILKRHAWTLWLQLRRRELMSRS